MVIEITKVDREHSSFTGKDKLGTEFVFHFGAFTKIRRLTPQESIRTVGEIGVSALPLAIDQEVLVNWRADLEKKRRLAVQITVY